jgi:hypothetical protein
MTPGSPLVRFAASPLIAPIVTFVVSILRKVLS